MIRVSHVTPVQTAKVESAVACAATSSNLQGSNIPNLRHSKGFSTKVWHTSLFCTEIHHKKVTSPCHRGYLYIVQIRSPNGRAFHYIQTQEGQRPV
jgi:hypothetical protein